MKTPREIGKEIADRAAMLSETDEYKAIVHAVAEAIREERRAAKTKRGTFTLIFSSRELELLSIGLRAGAGDDGINQLGLTAREKAMLGAVGNRIYDALGSRMPRYYDKPEDYGATSVQCPHCKWGFARSVIRQHIKEKHGDAAARDD